MQYNTFKTETYSGGSITRAGERTVYAKITVDLHESHTLKQEAFELMYTDALLSGAGTLSREAFIDAVNMLGASIYVHISNSTLTITLKSLSENLPKLLKLFEIMMTAPTFAEAEITRIKLQKKNELIEAKEEARSIAADNLINALYGKKDRRYSDELDKVIGTLADIKKNDLQKLHEKTRNGFWFVTVGGDKDSVAKVTNVIELCKKGIQETPVLKREHNQLPATQKVILKSIPSKQNIEFSIGAPLPMTMHHPDYLPFVFGLSVLGKWGGFTGRLMSTVREKEGLTYSIYARTESVRGTEQGYWRIMTFFSPKQAVQGLQSTLREITHIHEKGITKSEFERFQTILKTQQVLLADSLTSCVEELHGYLCEQFTLKEMADIKQRLLQVTKKDIDRALKTYLNPKTVVISGAGPITSVKKEIESLQSTK